MKIYLPVVEVSADKHPAARVDGEPAPTGGEIVLVVEDDPYVRGSVVARLCSLGYSVITAVDGNDALRQLRTGVAVDILLSDVVMPGGINGWELAEQAKLIRPGLPALLTSGYAIETLVKQGYVEANSMVLTKPYRKAVLARRLREILLVGSLGGARSESAVGSRA